MAIFGENITNVMNNLFGELGIIVILAFAVAFWFRHLANKAIARGKCLKVAIKSTQDFYDNAETLLNDSVLPDYIKGHVYDMVLAVTDEDANRIALNAIVDSFDLPEEEIKNPGRLSKSLNELSMHRPELVDMFYDTMSAGLVSILFSQDKNTQRVSTTYAGNNNHKLVRALASKIEKKLSSFNIGNGEGNKEYFVPAHR
ncbi:MAG: hypothetical protein DHS20C07_19290 [Methyloligella sp.]|nr:MAG: hypothetical protein DHS20C07_19290 [Methyloligella sp.]